MRDLRLLRFLFILLPFFLLGACSTRTEGGATSRRNPDRIDASEIRESNQVNALGVVQVLRPQWLTQRASQSFVVSSEIVVYLDNVRFGDTSSLSTISVDLIDHMERINATNAGQRWGMGHAGGVIYVGTRARP